MRAALAVLVIVALAGGAHPVRAQTVIQLDGAVNLGYQSTTAIAAAGDGPGAPVPTGSRAFTEVRPGILVASGSSRLAWRLGYTFIAMFDFTDLAGTVYSNRLDAALAAELSETTVFTLTAGAVQGGTVFQLSERAPEAGQPALRAPGNPALVAGSVGESTTTALTAHLRLGQGVTASFSTPQDDLGQLSYTLAGYASLERVFPRDAIGFELRSNLGRLRTQAADATPYYSITNSLLGRWSHDFSWRWSGFATAGVEQVVTLAGSYPLAILPTGSVNASYQMRDSALSWSFTHGAATNLQTGTVAMTDVVSARAAVSFDPVRARAFGVSAGFLHSQPLGEASALVAAGTGNAVQADAGIGWALTDSVVMTARYSLAYQFDQTGGVSPSLAQVFMLGVTARYSNDRYVPPVPTMGQRVDGGDAVGFPGARPVP
jgi:hypothetical protein